MAVEDGNEAVEIELDARQITPGCRGCRELAAKEVQLPVEVSADGVSTGNEVASRRLIGATTSTRNREGQYAEEERERYAWGCHAFHGLLPNWSTIAVPIDAARVWLGNDHVAPGLMLKTRPTTNALLSRWRTP